MAAESIAVLLMAYGGPQSLDEVEPYLLDVRGGRPTSPELVREIRHRYAAIGGRTPILERTEAQAAALARALGAGSAVYVGMRHWHPYINDVTDGIAAAGHRRLVGIVMAPHYSTLSVGAYEKKLLAAADGRLDAVVVPRWGDHPRFLDAVQEKVATALGKFSSPNTVAVVFTAHSLPQRILATGDPYVAEVTASAGAVAARLRLPHWRVAFQSAGASPEPWLGPAAADVITDLAARGTRDIVIVPIGFVCDHVEILFDVDIEYRALARKVGVRLERTESLNDSPPLIAALAAVARAAAVERGWIA